MHITTVANPHSNATHLLIFLISNEAFLYRETGLFAVSRDNVFSGNISHYKSNRVSDLFETGRKVWRCKFPS